MWAFERRIAGGLVALTAVLVPLGACFDFDATMAGGPLDDGGSSSSVLDGSVVDGSLPPGAGDSGGPSGNTDAGGTDAGRSDAGGGGGVDATADDGGGGGGGFCASLARPDGGLFFCDDFDEGYSVQGAWAVIAEQAGTLVETDASARSAPNSLQETTMPVTYNEVVNVALRTPESVPALPTTLLFAFSLEPIQIDPTANAAIVLGAVDFLDNAGNRYTAGLAINVISGQPTLALGEQDGVADGGALPDGGPPIFVNHPLEPVQPVAMNAWTDLVLELDWSATGLVGKVTVNGVQQLDVPLMLSVQPTALQIGVGTSYVTEYMTQSSPVWELRYDNVVFTAN